MWIGCGAVARADLAPAAVEVHEAREVAAHEVVAPRSSAAWPSFASASRVDTSGKPNENTPPKPQHVSASVISTSVAPAAVEQASRAWRPSPRLRSP